MRNFRLFWIGQLVSMSGTWMQTVAQNWLVLSLTGSGVALGVTVALQFLPMLLFGMWGGLVADRFDKRRILYVTQVVPMVLALVMFVLVATGAVALWMVYGLAFLLGLVFAVDMPTRQSFVVELVGPDEVPNAVGLNSAMFNTGRVVGPAVAGVLIATVGLASTFLLNALSYVAVMVALALMRPDELFAQVRAVRAPGAIRAGRALRVVDAGVAVDVAAGGRGRDVRDELRRDPAVAGPVHVRRRGADVRVADVGDVGWARWWGR